MALAIIVRVAISISLAYLLFKISKENIKYSLIFLVISLYLAGMAEGLIAMVVFYVLALIFILVFNLLEKKTKLKTSRVVMIVLSSILLLINIASIIMKISLNEKIKFIIMEIAQMILWDFFIYSSIEYRKEKIFYQKA